jgi:prephenate dehydrogenase
VKGPVVAELSAILHPALRFVGSHPMAGSEQQGLHAARPDLFKDHVCIVTPDAASDKSAIQEIGHFWEQLGCKVRQLAPLEHDQVVAAISHLPHLLAAVLVKSVADQTPAALGFAGPGFRDTTRIASGGPEMWSEILLSNRDAVRNSAEVMIEKLRDFLTLLDSASPGDQASMIQFLTTAKAQRDQLRVKG